MDNSRIGPDLAKNVFQVHGIDAQGRVVLNKSLRRAQLLPFFTQLPPCIAPETAWSRRARRWATNYAACWRNSA